MVSVVQLVEHRIVVPSVVGSSPITHPNIKKPGFWPGFLYVFPCGLLSLLGCLGLSL